MRCAARQQAGAAGLRPVHQGEPLFQSARCARRDLGDRARRLYRPRTCAGKGVLRRLARGRGRLMPDLLLELLTEEIPARMQGLAARELRRLVETQLAEINLTAKTVEAFVTPRRLALAVSGLPKMQPGSVE